MSKAVQDGRVAELGATSKPCAVTAAAPFGSVVSLYDKSRTSASTRPRPVPVDGFTEMVFEPEDMPCLLQAMDEAIAFLLDLGPVGPAKRREVALGILHCARSGVRDPHRLALKGIVCAA